MKLINLIEQRLEVIFLGLIGGLVRLMFTGIKINLLFDILGIIAGAITAGVITTEVYQTLTEININLSENSLAFLIGLLAKDIISTLLAIISKPENFIKLFKKNGRL